MNRMAGAGKHRLQVGLEKYQLGQYNWSAGCMKGDKTASLTRTFISLGLE